MVEGGALPEYLSVLGSHFIEVGRLIAVSGVSSHSVPNLSHEYRSEHENRASPSGDIGYAYIAMNQMAAQLEANSEGYINYLSASGNAVNIEHLPSVTRDAFKLEDDYGPSIAIRNYIYSQCGPVILCWNSIAGSGIPVAYVPPGMWEQVESRPEVEANPGLMYENPTWTQVPNNF